jgi:hypothetical protein
MADMLTATPPAPSILPTEPERRPPSKVKLQEIVGRLDAEATSRVGKRNSLEERWIADLEQYHGRYDAATAKNLFDQERCSLFINATRPKTDALGARLKDLLFPTDEKNWGISPTPVPSLSDEAQAAASAAREKIKQAQAAAAAPQQAVDQATEQGTEPPPPEQMAQMQGQAQQAAVEADAAKEYAANLNSLLEEARKRSDLMEKEIDDQLKECLYQSVKREQIDVTCKLGTGVTKGPVTGDKVRRGWKPDPQTGEHALQVSTGDRPAYRNVDIWGFFPDMDATCIEDSNGEFERHLMNRRMLRELQHLDGFEKDAIRRLLMLAPSTTAPAYLAQLRNIRAATQQVTGDLYHVWEY